jgi:hypothetical protein
MPTNQQQAFESFCHPEMSSRVVGWKVFAKKLEEGTSNAFA